MIYPCNIYGDPKQLTFLQKLSRKIIEQEDKLLNGCIRVYIIERLSGLPLCSSSRKIKGLMFSKPVHDKVFVKEILGLLDIAKLMANEHPENLPLSNSLNIPASGVRKPINSHSS